MAGVGQLNNLMNLMMDEETEVSVHVEKDTQERAVVAKGIYPFQMDDAKEEEGEEEEKENEEKEEENEEKEEENEEKEEENEEKEEENEEKEEENEDKRLSLASATDMSFYSAMDDMSWIHRNSSDCVTDDDDMTKSDLDETISHRRRQDREGGNGTREEGKEENEEEENEDNGEGNGGETHDQSPAVLAEKLRELESQVSAVKEKLKSAQKLKSIGKVKAMQKNSAQKVNSTFTVNSASVSEKVKGPYRLTPLDFTASPTPPLSSSNGLFPLSSVCHVLGDLSSSDDEFSHSSPQTGSAPGGSNRKVQKPMVRGRRSNSESVQPQGEKVPCPPPQKTLASSARRSNSESVQPQGEKVLCPPLQKTLASSAPSTTHNVFHPKFPVRIRNPKVSSSTFGVYCGDMQKVALRDVGKGTGPVGEWITVGVVVEKTGYKKSAQGHEYMIWKLSDLSDCQDPPVKLLLFGECLKQMWKMRVSTAVALSGAVRLDSSGDKKDLTTLKVTQPSQLIELGECMDLAFCKGQRKDGMSCRNFVNRSRGDYCVFHVHSAAQSLAARRGVLHTASNVPPKSWQGKEKGLADFSNVFYAGRMVTTQRQKQKTVTFEETRLQGKMAKVLTEAQTTATKHAIVANEQNKLAKMLQNATFGSRNLQKQLSSEKEKKEGCEGNKEKKEIGDPVRSFRQFMAVQRPVQRPVLRPPTLARGITQGSPVALTSAQPKLTRSDVAKRKAVAVISRKGGIVKSNPNSIKIDNKSHGATTSSSVTVSEVNACSTGLSPVPKRSKLGADDFTDDQLNALLQKKSSHQDQLDQEERKREDAYFNVMEAKDKVQVHMVELKEIKNVKVITCKKCGYTWHSQSDHCKVQGHLVQRHTANKRFFKCRQCSKRVICYEQFPTKPCQGCASKDFERVGMKEERKGPQTVAETLKVRGDERPFVG